MRMKAKSIGLRKRMMTMKNESKINRGTWLQFPTICPTISDIKNLHINEYDFKSLGCESEGLMFTHLGNDGIIS